MNGYKKFLSIYYLYRFFKDFAFIYAVYVILFKLRGLSVFDISILLAMWSGFVVILEVPTGALADKWNRKYMLSLGMLSKAIGFGVWFFANNFLLFALGFLFWGIGSTFCSGTQEALLFDSLKKFRKEKEYAKATGSANFYSKIAIGISVFIGGFLASYSLNLVIILSSLFMLIGIIPTLFLNEVKFRKTSTEEVKYFRLIKNAFKDSLKNKLILRLILYSFIVFAVIGTLDEYEQLYFNWINVPIAFFGVLAVTIMGSQAIGNRFAYKFQNYFRNENNIYLLSLLSGISLVMAFLYKSFLLFPFFVLVFFFSSVGEVLVETLLQKQIKAEKRATILSINNLSLNLSAIFLSIIFGILSEINLVWGFLFFALLVILFSLASIIYKKGFRSREDRTFI
jgi:MFS family permease